jgi:hypothetical protein
MMMGTYVCGRINRLSELEKFAAVLHCMRSDLISPSRGGNLTQTKTIPWYCLAQRHSRHAKNQPRGQVPCIAQCASRASTMGGIIGCMATAGTCVAMPYSPPKISPVSGQLSNGEVFWVKDLWLALGRHEDERQTFSRMRWTSGFGAFPLPLNMLVAVREGKNDSNSRELPYEGTNFRPV